MASLPISTDPVLSSFCEHRGGFIEHLRGVRLRAPGGGLAGEGKQIFGAERNALQRSAKRSRFSSSSTSLARRSAISVSGSASAL